MQECGLYSIRTTAKSDHFRLNALESPKNRIRQNFTAHSPNQIWVSDVTCFKIKDKYYYICVILDLFSRRVVSYTISKKNSTRLVTSAFKQAVIERGCSRDLVFHSDRGSQYLSHTFQQLLQQYKVKPSVSASGHPHDNAVAESFFASLKRENLYRKEYKSENAFRAGIAEYIQFYNEKRPHRLLKNRTPANLRKPTFQMRHSCSYRDFSEFYSCIFAVSLFYAHFRVGQKNPPKPIATELCGYKENLRNRLSQ